MKCGTIELDRGKFSLEAMQEQGGRELFQDVRVRELCAGEHLTVYSPFEFKLAGLTEIAMCRSS